MHSYAEFSDGVTPEHYIPLLREMITFDSLCPHSCIFARNHLGILGLERQPSPLHWSRQIEWPWAILESDLKPWDTCLDIGSSWSVFKFSLALRTKRVVCLDNDHEAVRKGMDLPRILKFKNIESVQGDCRSLPFNDNSFEKVFFLSTLEHVPNDAIKAIDEIQRVLKPGGVAMISMDMVVDGKGDGFNLGHKEMSQILTHLKFREISPKNTVGARMKEGCAIAVVLVRLYKHKEFPNLEVDFT